MPDDRIDPDEPDFVDRLAQTLAQRGLDVDITRHEPRDPLRAMSHAIAAARLELPDDVWVDLAARWDTVLDKIAEDRADRAALIDLIGRAANERYADVLDKLADL
jgi:ActR/RegA family two-component response regulator